MGHTHPIICKQLRRIKKFRMHLLHQLPLTVVVHDPKHSLGISKRKSTKSRPSTSRKLSASSSYAGDICQLKPKRNAILLASKIYASF